MRTWLLLLIILLGLGETDVWARSCQEAAEEYNRHQRVSIDAVELAEMLDSLNTTENRLLPAKFITKRQAKESGWRPGKDLWRVPALLGKSIGGDTFGNREGKLPHRKKWREADLDYKGGHRGAKRLVFSNDGVRLITTDHYATFTEVSPCR